MGTQTTSSRSKQKARVKAKTAANIARNKKPTSNKPTISSSTPKITHSKGGGMTINGKGVGSTVVARYINKPLNASEKALGKAIVSAGKTDAGVSGSASTAQSKAASLAKANAKFNAEHLAAVSTSYSSPSAALAALNKERASAGDNPLTSAEESKYNSLSYSGIKDSTELDSFLNTSQDDLFSMLETGDVGTDNTVGLLEKIQKMLTPETPRPELIDSEQTFDQLRQKYDVENLETQLVDFDKQIADFDLSTEQRITQEEGRTVPMGVIEGRKSEIQIQQDQARQKLVNERNYIADQLNIKYNLVSQMMQYKQFDYQAAVAEYNTQFSQNLQVITLVQGIVSEANQQAQNQQNAARANFQIYLSALDGVGWDELTADQQSQIGKLSAQSGIPSNLAQAMFIAKDQNDIISTTSREANDGYKYIDIISKNKKTGETTSESIKVGKVAGSRSSSGSRSSLGPATPAPTTNKPTSVLSSALSGVMSYLGIDVAKESSRIDQLVDIDAVEYGPLLRPNTKANQQKANTINSYSDDEFKKYYKSAKNKEATPVAIKEANAVFAAKAKQEIQSKINELKVWYKEDVQSLSAVKRTDKLKVKRQQLIDAGWPANAVNQIMAAI